MHVEINPKRLTHLDGLRGLAALSVVLAHFLAAFDPQLQFGSDFGQQSNWQTIFSASPGFLLINGSFSVYIFMVLSGFVISGASDRSPTPILNFLFARFSRLHIPAACAVVFAMILFESNALSLHLVHPLIDHWWIKLYYNPTALIFGKQFPDFIGRHILTGASDYVPPLWTMQAEFFASCACFLFFSCLKQKCHRFAALPVVMLFVILIIPSDRATLYLAFIFGVALWDFKPAINLSNWIVALALLVGCLLGGMSQFLKPENSFYPLLFGGLAEYLRTNILFVWAVAAAMIVLSALLSRRFQSLLRTQICQFLGRISFSMYLIHFPILGSLGSTLYLGFGQGSVLGFGVVLAVYLAVVLCVATMFEVVIDRNAVAFSKWLRKMQSKKIA